MNKDELNALQYAGGYVPHALLKKDEKRSGGKFKQFNQCLGDMAVECEHSDFFEYTKEWIGRVTEVAYFHLMI